jgi:hypothetical protein
MTWHHRWIFRDRRPPTSTDEATIDWTVKDAPGADAGSCDDSLGTSTTGRARRRRAANIYGTIVTAAVIAAGGNTLSSAQLSVTIIVTLVVYWLAEQYAELLGAHTSGGHLPSAGLVRSSLAEAWPMVTASFVPVASIGVAVLFGVSASDAAHVALIVTVILLVAHGYNAGRIAGLRGWQRLLVTLIAALLGVAMIILKSALQHHHY